MQKKRLLSIQHDKFLFGAGQNVRSNETEAAEEASVR
jgi:hypothetical protein